MESFAGGQFQLVVTPIWLQLLIVVNNRCQLGIIGGNIRLGGDLYGDRDGFCDTLIAFRPIIIEEAQYLDIGIGICLLFRGIGDSGQFPFHRQGIILHLCLSGHAGQCDSKDRLAGSTLSIFLSPVSGSCNRDHDLSAYIAVPIRDRFHLCTCPFLERISIGRKFSRNAQHLYHKSLRGIDFLLCSGYESFLILICPTLHKRHIGRGGQFPIHRLSILHLRLTGHGGQCDDEGRLAGDACGSFLGSGNGRNDFDRSLKADIRVPIRNYP